MRRSPQYAVAITAVHKWEERFMREWLEYHLLVGVGHFFLFPNDCDADSATRKLLVPYERAGVVTVDGEFDCAKGAQTRAYRRSIERYGTRAAWMAFIDLDEFIVVRAPMEPRSCMGWGTCLASVSSLVGGFNASSWPAVALPWRLFGTSGHVARPHGPVTVAYYKRASSRQAKDWRARSYKSVANMAACRAATVHVCSEFAPGWRPGLFTVNGERLELGKSTLRKAHQKFGQIYLAHYRTRSLEDWLGRGKRGTADVNCRSTSCLAKASVPAEYNAVTDRTIARNVEKRIRQCAWVSRRRGVKAESAVGLLREILLGEAGGTLGGSRHFEPSGCVACWLQASGPACGGVARSAS